MAPPRRSAAPSSVNVASASVPWPGRSRAIDRYVSDRSAIWAPTSSRVSRVPWTKTIGGARRAADRVAASAGRSRVGSRSAGAVARAGADPPPGPARAGPRTARPASGSSSPSLARMFDTCVRAVRSVMPSSSAMARFESPRATPPRTSRSRAVRVAVARGSRVRAAVPSASRRPAWPRPVPGDRPRPTGRASRAPRCRRPPGRGGPRRRPRPGSRPPARPPRHP